MTAGAGLDYRGLGADYQYEDNPLGDIHRFGLSVRFGKTVEESRLAYMATAEADIQARLESAFNERALAQENQLVAETHQALESATLGRCTEHDRHPEGVGPGSAGS